MKNDDLEFIDDLLKKYEAEQDCVIQQNPTVFEILGRTYDEDLISRMLAYTLKKDVTLVRNILLHFCKMEIPPCRIINVECEKSMCGGRADLFFEVESENGVKYALTIENKIYSWEHNDQTETYFKYVKAQARYAEHKNVFVYLKPDFNYSLPTCKEFKVLTYNELIELLKLGEMPKDAIICDFIKHIENNLISKEVKLMDTDTKVLENYSKLKEIIRNAERKFEEVKRQVVAEIFTNNNIRGLNYNPNEYHNEKIDNGTLIIEVANYESCYRVYRKDLWHHYSTELRDKYYFFVELKFCDNDPTNIIVQKLIKRYGQKAQESIVYKFLDENKDIIYDGNSYGVLSPVKHINLSEDILSVDWKKALKEKVIKLITEAIDEMDEIFTRFMEWKKVK